MNINLSNSRILIIDDRIDNIEILEGFLLVQGYEDVRSVTDPREIFPLLPIFKPDIMLLDLMMPHLSGFEVLEKLKAILPENEYLPVLVLTADATVEAKQRALTLGATDFLTKPFDLVEVGLRIKNLLLARHLMLQLQDQNLALDIKVKERTADLVRMNKELKLARDKAEASDRLKTAFMNNISHEVRTPLNGIIGFSNLLIKKDIGEKEKKEYLSMLEFSVNRLINTITDYMDISLLVTGNMVASNRTVLLSKELEEVRGKFTKMCEAKNLALNFSINPVYSDLTIYTDPDFLGKILSHILDNAVKFTEEGSISVSFALKDDNILFQVQDSGCGISEEGLEIIFDNFTQENEASTRGYEGSGLGLSITKGLLTLLDGDISIKSQKQAGTLVSFHIPCKQKSVHSSKPAYKTVKLPVKSDHVVLIAEDDLLNRRLLEIILMKRVSVVLQASNGAEAVELCRSHPEIELVLMDLKMPEMDGFEATREIKSFRKDLPVIAVTAFALNGDEEQAKLAGCTDYITKPVSTSRLFSILSKHGISA